MSVPPWTRASASVLIALAATGCRPAVDDDGHTDVDDTERPVDSDTDADETDPPQPSTFCLPEGTTFRRCDPGVVVDRWWSDLVPDPFLVYDEDHEVPWEMFQVALNDFDGDGDDDILVGSQPGELSLWLRERDGFVKTPLGGPVRPAVLGLVADDFDGDGVAEGIAAALRMDHDETRAYLSAHLNGQKETPYVPTDFFLVRKQSDGTFALEPTDDIGLGETGFVETLSLGDLDADGRNELLVASLDPHTPTMVYKGLAGGKWRSAPELGPAGIASNAMLSVHDATGDGQPDLFVGAFAGHGAEASAIWVDGDTGWTQHRVAPFDGEIGVSLMGGSFLDADLDGTSDVYVTNIGRQHLVMMSPGEFQGVDVTQAAHAGIQRTIDSEDYPVAWGVRGIDLDGDRDPDIATPAGFENLFDIWDQQFLLFWNHGVDGDGVPQFERDLTPDVVATTHERGLIAADLNGDGWPDLLPAPAGSRPMRLLVNPGFPGRTMKFVELHYPTGQGAEGAQVLAHYDDGVDVAHVATGSSGFSGSGRVGVWLALEGLEHVTVRSLSSLDTEVVAAGDLGRVLVVEP